MINKRNSIILGLLFVILVVEIVILAPRELNVKPEEDTPPPPVTSSAGAGQVMENVDLIESKGEKKEWQLKAKKGVQLKEDQNWTIEEVNVKFFGENGVYYNVTGQKGTVVLNKNDIKIEGNVITRSSNGYIFKTETAFYNSAQRRLTSPLDVSMTGPKDENGNHFEMTGTDMLADMLSNEMVINKNVKGRKTIRDGKLANISSDRAVFSGKENSARFFGHVVIDVETMRITGPTARFGYKKGSDSIESVFVEGGVKVTDVDKWATSETLNVLFDDDKFIFKGSPRVVQNGDELVGDEIVFLHGGRKVQVSNARAEFNPKDMENHR